MSHPSARCEKKKLCKKTAVGPEFFLCSHFYWEIVPVEIMLVAGDIASCRCILTTLNGLSTKRSDHSKLSRNFMIYSFKECSCYCY